MTGSPEQRGDLPSAGAPPWTPELLADLHAGVLPAERADTLRTAVREDPRAQDVLAALDSVIADLGALNTVEHHPIMPTEVADRLDAALRAAGGPTPRTGIATTSLVCEPPPRPISLAGRRRARTRWGAGLLLVAAATVGAVFFAGPGQRPETKSPPLALSSGRLDTLPGGIIGAREYGSLAEPSALAVCLRANGLPPTTAPLGARLVMVGRDRTPGVLLVLPGGRPATFRLLVVGIDCGADRPATLGDSVIGG